MNDTAAKLDKIATALNDGKGTAGKLLKDDSLYNNLNSTLKHANSLLAEADAGKGGLGLLTKDPTFARKLNDTVSQLNLLLTNVNTGKGTLGKLATDDAAYTNLNNLLTLEHRPGDDDPQGSEEVSGHSTEDLLGGSLRGGVQRQKLSAWWCASFLHRLDPCALSQPCMGALCWLRQRVILLFFTAVLQGDPCAFSCLQLCWLLPHRFVWPRAFRRLLIMARLWPASGPTSLRRNRSASIFRRSTRTLTRARTSTSTPAATG